MMKGVKFLLIPFLSVCISACGGGVDSCSQEIHVHMFNVSVYDTATGSLLCEVNADLGVTDSEAGSSECIVEVENTVAGVPDGTAQITVSLVGYETTVYESVEYEARRCHYEDTTEVELFLEPADNL